MGLKIKVTIDDKSLKQALTKLQKGVEVPVKFDSKSLKEMTSQIEKLNSLSLKSLANTEELKNLAKASELLNKQIKLYEKLNQTKKAPTNSSGTSDNSSGANDDNYKNALNIQKELYALKTKRLDTTREEMALYTKRINQLDEELMKSKALITDEGQLKTLKQEQGELESAYNTQYNLRLVKLKEVKHLAQQELDLVLKKFEASKNFEYVDEAKYNTFKQKVVELDGLTTKQVTAEVKRLKLELKDLTSDANTKRIANTSKSFSLLGVTLSQITKFASLTMVLRTLWTELQKGYDHIKTVDEAFTNMSMTMESLTREGFDGMLDKVNELSQSMGAVSSDVLKIAQTFANDSTSLQAVMDKLAPSIALMNISGMNPTEVTKSIMSIANSYQMLAEDGSNAAEVTEYLGDVMAKVSANMDMDFVEGMEGLVSGIGVAGSTMRAAGVDMEWFVGQLGNAMVSTGQTADKLGRGMRTITARVMQQKQTLEELGESTEDIELIFANGEKALGQLGIAIRDDLTGDLRSFSTVMDELGAKWDDLSDSSKYYIAEVLAGKNQMDIFIGMMDSYQNATNLVEQAYQSQGTLMEMNEKYADSLQGKTNTLVSSFQELYQTVLNTDGFKALLDLITKLIQGVTELVKTFESLGGVGGLGAVALATPAVSTLGKSVTTLGTKLGALVPQITGVTMALEGMGSASLAQKAILGVGLPGAIGAAILAIGLIEKNHKTLSESVDDTVASMKELNTEAEKYINIETNLTRYEQLHKELQGVAENSEKSAELLKEINSIRVSLSSEDAGMEKILNNEYLSLEKQLFMIREINKERLKTSVETFEKENNQETLDKLKDGIDYQLNLWKGQREALERARDNDLDYVDWGGQLFEVNLLNQKHQETSEVLSSQYSKWLEIESQMQKFKENGISTKLVLGEMTDEASELLNEIVGINDAVNDSKDSTAKKPNLSYDRASDEDIAKLNKDYLETTEKLENARDLLKEINKEGLNLENASDVLDMFDDFTGNITNAIEVQEFLNNKIAEMKDTQSQTYQQMLAEDEQFWETKVKNSESWKSHVDATNQSIHDLGVALLGEESQDFVNYINERNQQRLIDLENAKSMAHAEKILTASTVNDLGAYFAGLVDDKSGFRQTDFQNIINFLNEAGEAEVTTINELRAKWKTYFQDTYNALNQRLMSLSETAYEGDKENIYSDMMKLQQENNKMNQFFDKVATFDKVTGSLSQKTTSGLSSGSSGSSSSSSSSKSEVADLELKINRYYELENAMKRVENALSLNKVKQENASASEKVKLMKEEVELLKQKQALTEKNRKELNKEANELKKTLQSNGFRFDANGQITNYEKRLIELEKSTNKLTGSKKEKQKEKVEELVEAIERYTELVNDSIPSMAEDWADLTSQIKEAQRAQLEYVSDIQSKITDALKEELQKRTDAVKSELEKQKELYNQQFEEEDWEDSLKKEQRKLDELKQMISNLSRDTSEAGQLKLKELMTQYEEQLETMNQMIRDKEKENGNNAFDAAIEELDKKLEESLDAKNLAQMVNQALTKGFIDLEGEVITTENLLTQMLETSGEAFTALGKTLRTELVDGLKVAKELATGLGSTINGIGFSNNSRSVFSVSDASSQLTSRMVDGLGAIGMIGRQIEQSVTLSFGTLLNVEGNLDSSILSDVEMMIDNAKTEITYSVAKALQTV